MLLMFLNKLKYALSSKLSCTIVYVSVIVGRHVVTFIDLRHYIYRKQVTLYCTEPLLQISQSAQEVVICTWQVLPLITQDGTQWLKSEILRCHPVFLCLNLTITIAFFFKLILFCGILIANLAIFLTLILMGSDIFDIQLDKIPI